MSKEEVEFSTRCMRESFFKRCVPLMAINSTGLYFLFKQGLIRRPSPLLIVGTNTASYMLGKLTYAGVCTRRMREQFPQGVLSQLQESNRGRSMYPREQSEPYTPTDEPARPDWNVEQVKETEKSGTSYEELRKKNRRGPKKKPDKEQEAYSLYPAPVEQEVPKPKEPQWYEAPPRSAPVRRNKYGDIIED